MRIKGATTKRIRYKVEVFDLINEVWSEKGKYKNYKDISIDIGYSYDNIRDISLGRNKKLMKFYRISKILKN